MDKNLTFRRICEYCGKEFEAKTLYTRYCNHTCNSRHYKKLKREAKIQSVLQPLQNEPELLKFDTTVQHREFLNVVQAASLLGTSKRTIHRLIANGKLKAGKVGRRTIVKRIEIDKLFN